MTGARGSGPLAMFAMASGAWIVLVQKWGPVVATVSPGHGVHTGDALGVAAAGLGMWLMAQRVRAPRPALALARHRRH